MTPAFAYLQARLQAYHGQRLDEVAWRQLEMVQGYAPFLHHARETSLGPWLQAVDADGGVTALEQRLKESLNRRVAEVARCSPSGWQPAILWCLHLWDLPARRHKSAGLPLPATWILPEQSLLETGGEEQTSLLEVWLQHWYGLWPKESAAGRWRKSLQSLVALLRAHANHFSTLQETEAAILARSGLRQRLQRLFRTEAHQPTIIFVYLTLLALDYERLRGGLVVRTLYHPEANQ